MQEVQAMLKMMFPLVGRAFPWVKEDLAKWETYACKYASSPLSDQALASIRDKRFHCLGGSVYSLYPGVNPRQFISFIVALQTISDYLDNLCDRLPGGDEAAFRQLHLAMTDALDPGTALHDYYRFYPAKDDGAYLTALVEHCRRFISTLPCYHLVKDRILYWAGLYCELQTYKHLSPLIREKAMIRWTDRHIGEYPYITRWEWAAASGSTLGLFVLTAAAADPSLSRQAVNRIASAYFPWITGFHILLDYFIDQSEDAAHDDLNFVSYYQGEGETCVRLTYFMNQACQQASKLPHPAYTLTVVRGLAAMYLSDPKADSGTEQAIKKSLLAHAGGYTKFMYQMCGLLRRHHLL
ncbi:tetraprenyl-beta-curcumene synthase family protein [Acetonema longum]|uniref:Tetraprenyl-beta-curcumene synthase n=1 Tax=Acetonema longum DSM 6540 TaxID=1009370 RepID=F7NIX1_9FIRM|nr:tetraprenyl-beta-curcumene synthase family protein [Acetonema longum]EGO63968.1 hypothetical protein ALO_10119 [Acetonema longum DSM 6540]